MFEVISENKTPRNRAGKSITKRIKKDIVKIIAVHFGRQSLKNTVANFIADLNMQNIYAKIFKNLFTFTLHCDIIV